jgi:hypothetical protein
LGSVKSFNTVAVSHLPVGNKMSTNLAGDGQAEMPLEYHDPNPGTLDKLIASNLLICENK